MTKWLADRDLALVAAGVAVCMVVGPMLDTYLLGIATTMLVFVSLTAAWHLVGGYLGQLSIGHSALFGVGAYAAAIAGADSTTPFLLVLLAGAAGAVFIAILIFNISGSDGVGAYFIKSEFLGAVNCIVKNFSIPETVYLPASAEGVFADPCL